MNIVAYLLYFILTYFITVRVGLIFYRNGRVFMLHLFHGDSSLTDFINRILLVGYYLLNLGYAAVMISTWKTISSFGEVLVTVTRMTGLIMLTLAIIHFFNMTVLYLLGKRNLKFHHSKK